VEGFVDVKGSHCEGWAAVPCTLAYSEENDCGYNQEEIDSVRGSCVASCKLCSGASLAGDPWFRVDKQRKKIDLEEGVENLLLRVGEGPEQVELYGTVIAKGPSQWFNSFIFRSKGGEERLKVSTKSLSGLAAPAVYSNASAGIGMQIIANGNEMLSDGIPAIHRDSVHDLGSGLAAQLKRTTKRGRQADLDVKLGGKLMKIYPARSMHFKSAVEQLKYGHLNIKFPHGLPEEGATGPLAKLAGVDAGTRANLAAKHQVATLLSDANLQDGSSCPVALDPSAYVCDCSWVEEWGCANDDGTDCYNYCCSSAPPSVPPSAPPLPPSPSPAPPLSPSPLAAAPPPPSLLPPPPSSDSGLVVTSATVIAEENLEDYNADNIAAMEVSIADELGVNADQVSVTVTSGSVYMQINVTYDTTDDCDAGLALLNEKIATPEDATIFLSTDMLATNVVEIPAPPHKRPKYSGPLPPAPASSPSPASEEAAPAEFSPNPVPEKPLESTPSPEPKEKLVAPTTVTRASKR